MTEIKLRHEHFERAHTIWRQCWPDAPPRGDVIESLAAALAAERAEAEARAHRHALTLADALDNLRCITAALPCPRCFGTGGCDHVLIERVSFIHDALTRRVEIVAEAEARAFERAAQVIREFGRETSNDDNRELCGALGDTLRALAAAARDGGEADTYRCVNGHDLCYLIWPGPECQYCERAPTARKTGGRDD